MALQCLAGTAGGKNLRRFRTARVDPNKNQIFGTLDSRAIDWCLYGSNQRGSRLGGRLGGSRLLGTPHSKFFPGSSNPVDWHPLTANWVKAAVRVHSWESVPWVQGCGPWRGWRQTCGNKFKLPG
eukprot:1141535-Pelagomonas_calceolata.AAC.2